MIMDCSKYRNLTDQERTLLESYGNWAEDWDLVRVSGEFCCPMVRNNCFMGQVFLGRIGASDIVDASEMDWPLGIYGSTLRDCTIGDHCAIHNVHLLRGYRVGSTVCLANIDEMTHEPYGVPYLEPMNECGGRKIIPFPGMRVGDAYLWAKFRDRKVMMDRLDAMTQELLAENNGLGIVGDCATITNTKMVRNVAVESTENDSTLIRNCICLETGVIRSGSRLTNGIIAERFVLGEHVKLEKGLRLYDTVVGDNSTLACCEVGCDIIFPAHEQHHNNSFLIASVVMGQSNVAAGCTIGSNHNGRTADNEIVAGRGFWPGLCSSFKHSSRFASYCLLSKAAYPYELDIKLPFALVNNNEAENRLEVMPAYWWMYNMYALDRNCRKFAARDERTYQWQHIETNPFAPDTAEEIVHGINLLRQWMKESTGTEVYGRGMEKGKRKCLILKAAEAVNAYEDMLYYYAMQALEGHEELIGLKEEASREQRWVNLGGQLIGGECLEQLIGDIEAGRLSTWDQIHERMDILWNQYPAMLHSHAYSLLCHLESTDCIDEKRWQRLQKRYENIKQYVADQVRITREKDNNNPFRQMTYDTMEEMYAVLGQ